MIDAEEMVCIISFMLFSILAVLFECCKLVVACRKAFLICSVFTDLTHLNSWVCLWGV